MSTETKARVLATLAAARRRGDNDTISLCVRKLKEAGVRV